jgi:hypothetical protein
MMPSRRDALLLLGIVGAGLAVGDAQSVLTRLIHRVNVQRIRSFRLFRPFRILSFLFQCHVARFI